jgi:imidazole glycerol-phosphate synthase subunit HisH
VPFIGWTRIDTASAAGLQGSLLEQHDPKRAVYLVHSYHVLPEDASHRLGTYTFGGHEITAAIRKGNITGFQFHPEKSGEAGLAMMRRFIAGL